jgi:hypothetical protein
MQAVKSTAQVLAFKVLNRPITIEWIDWALEMMMAGFDTEHLAMLAGEREPFDEFHMQDLTDKVLRELQLDFTDKDMTINHYVSYLIDKALSEELDTLKVLRIFKNLAEEIGNNIALNEFYQLYYAKQDLMADDYQYYWPGANKNNIDQIIRNRFFQWKTENPS